MSKYIATLRIIFDAEDDISAAIVADQIIEDAGVSLEDDDTCDLTQILEFSRASELEPLELLQRLARTRNDLIRTRMNSNLQLANDLDRVMHSIKRRLDPSDPVAQTNYDFGRAISIADRVLNFGEDPND